MAGHVVSGLTDKRAELAGLIAALEARITQHRTDLVHIDAVLRLYGETAPEEIRPKRAARRNGWFATGECSRLVLDALRTADGELDTASIAQRMMAARGLDAADARTRELIHKTVLGSLGRLRPTVERLPPLTPGGSARWRLQP